MSQPSTDPPTAAAPTTDQAVQVEHHDGGVVLIRLHRPAQRNGIDPPSCDTLTELFRSATTDASVRAMVLTGSGRDYCTGADLAAGKATTDFTTLDYRYATDRYRAMFQALWEVERPVVTAVNGTVAGAGWMYALMGDLVVAERSARWTHVFSRRGMVPHAGDPYFLPRILPFHRLNEIALLGDPVTSAQLAEWGAVNRLVDGAEVLPTAMELATRLAAGPTRSLGFTKRLYRRSLSSSMDAAFEDERNATALLSTTADRREGVASLMEGRPARFVGN